MEVWKDIVDFSNYQVSNFGRVKSLSRLKANNTGNYLTKERILIPFTNPQGYQLVELYKNNKGYIKKIHRLVAKAFIQNPNNYKEVNHKDENKANNCVENLEWCSRKYNCNYGERNKKISNTMKRKEVNI